MAEAVEWYVAVTALVVGASHLLRPHDWAEAFRQLHRCGRPGAFANGGLSLVTGAAIVAGHGSWAWPGAVLTGFGWLLAAKGAASLLAPNFKGYFGGQGPLGRDEFKHLGGAYLAAFPGSASETQATIAEGDLVQIMFRRHMRDPRDPGKTIDVWWYDTYRLRDGMIVEHWDCATQ